MNTSHAQSLAGLDALELYSLQNQWKELAWLGQGYLRHTIRHSFIFKKANLSYPHNFIEGTTPLTLHTDEQWSMICLLRVEPLWIGSIVDYKTTKTENRTENTTREVLPIKSMSMMSKIGSPYNHKYEQHSNRGKSFVNNRIPISQAHQLSKHPNQQSWLQQWVKVTLFGILFWLALWYTYPHVCC